LGGAFKAIFIHSNVGNKRLSLRSSSIMRESTGSVNSSVHQHFQ